MLDPATQKEIDKLAWRVLRDAGQDRPPVCVRRISEHLKLHCGFYNLKDPGFLDHAKYQLRVGKELLIEVVQKAKLVAALFFDERRIVIDDSLPVNKREFPESHECTHELLPWHRGYFMGDTAETLEADFQEQLEAEANFGASNLMLCGPVFNAEALDTKPTWGGVEGLIKRYKKSIVITARRFVERGPAVPMLLMVSTPAWKAKPADQAEWWRYFVPSPEFHRRFGAVQPRDVLVNVNVNARPRRGGLVGEFTMILGDANGDAHQFEVRSFFNTHYLVTLAVHQKCLSSTGIVVPSSYLLPGNAIGGRR